MVSAMNRYWWITLYVQLGLVNCTPIFQHMEWVPQCWIRHLLCWWQRWQSRPETGGQRPNGTPHPARSIFWGIFHHHVHSKKESNHFWVNKSLSMMCITYDATLRVFTKKNPKKISKKNFKKNFRIFFRENQMSDIATILPSENPRIVKYLTREKSINTKIKVTSAVGYWISDGRITITAI
jgi:hypothetical protein